MLHVMRSRGLSFREIGRILDRPAGTLCKELKRNRSVSPRIWREMSPLERSSEAHRMACARAKKSRQRERFQGILREAAFLEWVADKLINEKWSPEIIANNVYRYRLGETVSTSTLYRFIKFHWREMIRELPRKGKSYRRKICGNRALSLGGKSIHERPDIAEEFGHHEVDTIVSSKHSTSILSSRERISRYAVLERIPDLKAETTKHRLHGQIANLPQYAARSWTHDNGPEFARLYEVRGVETYRCDPYCSWQSGRCR